MLPNILLLILFALLSTLTTIFPSSSMIPLAIYEAFDWIGDTMAIVNSWVPGLVPLVLEFFFVIISVEVAIFTIIYGKSIINWLRGSGKI